MICPCRFMFIHQSSLLTRLQVWFGKFDASRIHSLRVYDNPLINQIDSVAGLAKYQIHDCRSVVRFFSGHTIHNIIIITKSYEMLKYFLICIFFESSNPTISFTSVQSNGGIQETLDIPTFAHEYNPGVMLVLCLTKLICFFISTFVFET